MVFEVGRQSKLASRIWSNSKINEQFFHRQLREWHEENVIAVSTSSISVGSVVVMADVEWGSMRSGSLHRFGKCVVSVLSCQSDVRREMHEVYYMRGKEG